MRASEIEIGREYMTCTSPDYTQRYHNQRRVQVLEVPVVGWARRYGWSEGPIKGKVKTDPKARRDHVLVKEYKRDYDLERTVKFAEFDRQAEERKAEEDWEHLAQETQEQILTAIMDSIPTVTRWKDAGEDRIALRHFRMTWQEWDERLQRQEERLKAAKDDAVAKKRRAEALNVRLAERGLELSTEWLGKGKDNTWRLRAIKHNDWDLLHAIENLLDEAGA